MFFVSTFNNKTEKLLVCNNGPSETFIHLNVAEIYFHFFEKNI